MNLKLNYKSRTVSTKTIMDSFDPPLVFSVKTRPTIGWFDAIGQIDNDVQDVGLAFQIIDGICFNVSDGEISMPLANIGDVKDFYQLLKEQAPEMADELVCDLSYELASEFIRYRRERLDELKKTSPPSDNGSNEKTPARVS